jgi:type VI secretion system protein VasJ
MAILHPQECYLLERFTSSEHYALTRDAIIEYVNAHETALARYKKDIPLNSRNLPLWQQADIIWENRVMPNLRDLPQHFITRTIQRINNDPDAFSIGDAMGSIRKGIVDFWDGWMTEDEGALISHKEYFASALDGNLSRTIFCLWDEGDLTYDYKNITSESIFKLPQKIPRYELDHSVRIELNEKPSLTGIYLPDIDFAPACFIYADYQYPPDAHKGITRSDYIDEDGNPSNSWSETEWVETGWTLIRRVEGEYIDVPPEGFFPEGKPEELYNWSLSEDNFQYGKMVRIAKLSAEISTHTGQWAATINGTTQYIHLRQDEKMPEFEDVYGIRHRASWVLIKRDDGGNVFIQNK